MWRHSQSVIQGLSGYSHQEENQVRAKSRLQHPSSQTRTDKSCRGRTRQQAPHTRTNAHMQTHTHTHARTRTHTELLLESVNQAAMKLNVINQTRQQKEKKQAGIQQLFLYKDKSLPVSPSTLPACLVSSDLCSSITANMNTESSCC